MILTIKYINNKRKKKKKKKKKKKSNNLSLLYFNHTKSLLFYQSRISTVDNIIIYLFLLILIKYY